MDTPVCSAISFIVVIIATLYPNKREKRAFAKKKRAFYMEWFRFTTVKGLFRQNLVYQFLLGVDLSFETGADVETDHHVGAVSLAGELHGGVADHLETSSMSPSMLVNMAFVSFGRPDSQITSWPAPRTWTSPGWRRRGRWPPPQAC